MQQDKCLRSRHVGERALRRLSDEAIIHLFHVARCQCSHGACVIVCEPVGVLPSQNSAFSCTRSLAIFESLPDHTQRLSHHHFGVCIARKLQHLRQPCQQRSQLLSIGLVSACAGARVHIRPLWPLAHTALRLSTSPTRCLQLARRAVAVAMSTRAAQGIPPQPG